MITLWPMTTGSSPILGNFLIFSSTPDYFLVSTVPGDLIIWG